jgi:hypothetical protein
MRMLEIAPIIPRKNQKCNVAGRTINETVQAGRDHFPAKRIRGAQVGDEKGAFIYYLRRRREKMQSY